MPILNKKRGETTWLLRLGYDENDVLSNYNFCCFVAVDS